MAEGMLAEAPVLWKNGWPTTLAKLAEFMPATFLLWLVGPLGPEAVAVAGMGSFWVNVTGVSMVVGFGIGMIPLASQAYGAKNYERVGAILVRQQCIHLLVSTGVLALWWNTEAALDTLDQPDFIASGTAEFVRWRMPALPFLVLNQNFSSFLQCQRVFKPMMYVGVAMNPISIFLFWLMITRLEMGTSGGALALTLSDALRAILNYCATRIYGDPRTLPNYCSAALWSQVFDLGGIAELLKLSLPGALTVWSEWWAWECCVVMAGWLCAVTATDECAPLAAQPILGNTMVLGFMVTFGVNTAACTQVGNYLGAGEPQRAKSSAHAAATMVLILAVSASSLLFVFRKQWAGAFSPDDDAAAALIVSCMPLVCVYITLDALGIGLLNSILRAAGRVKVPGLINLLSFYVVGLPVSFWLAFGDHAFELGLAALWIGLDLGMLVMTISLAVYFLRLDWDFEAEKARDLALQTRSPGNSPVAKGARNSDHSEIRKGGDEEGERAQLLSST